MIRAYHGTTAGEFTVFRPKYARNQQLGFGVHFTPSRELAMRYATDEATAHRGKVPALYEVDLDIRPTLDARALVKQGSLEFELCRKLAGARLFALKDEQGIPTVYVQRCIDATDPKRAERLIREAGYDSVLYTASVRSSGGMAPGYYRVHQEEDTYVVLNPAKIHILHVNHLGGKKAAKTVVTASALYQRKSGPVGLGGIR